MSQPTGRVLLTGANGFIAAHILSQLIEHKYYVIATVRSESKAQELIALHPQWKPHVTFTYVPDLTKEGAYQAAFEVGDVDYVIHAASPTDFSVTDLQEQMIKPAVEGTVELLSSAHKYGNSSLKRVVILGSAAAVLDSFEYTVKPRKPYTETDWNPITVEHAVKQGNVVLAYCASKTLAERAAWKYMTDHTPHFDLTVLDPVTTIGPMLQPVSGPSNINGSNLFDVYSFVAGQHQSVEAARFPFYHFIDVRDVARGHILALTAPAASNKRIILSSGLITPQLVANAIRKNFPDLREKVPEGTPEAIVPVDTHPGDWDTGRSREVFGAGWECIGLEECVRDAVGSFLEYQERCLCAHHHGIYGGRTTDHEGSHITRITVWQAQEVSSVTSLQ
ncbi:NAD(P)-binding protein [Aaosphaeria arxii CBS 175.79]|uniref:NAD(P)-binding protein n=1 Tax=Aaosphaeria arxii CBS 175.79 TaxID=1450172 RepID=A0A6A5Y909_9PLEO|nr:NAD(P)-binding protein [Aaosphaeria arxii CBS 175.79]KAF2021497.1 NAD(P)-binding protein [Aaosphaeria arxii CBS 175.79]